MSKDRRSVTEDRRAEQCGLAVDGRLGADRRAGGKRLFDRRAVAMSRRSKELLVLIGEPIAREPDQIGEQYRNAREEERAVENFPAPAQSEDGEDDRLRTGFAHGVRRLRRINSIRGCGGAAPG